MHRPVLASAEAFTLPMKMTPYSVTSAVESLCNWYGGEAIRRWGETCEPVPRSRWLHRTVVTTLGLDWANVSTEFTSDATPLIGRQTQTWARLGDVHDAFGGWTIVVAHVSLIEPV